MLGQYTSFGSHSSAVLIWLEQACRWPSRCHALAGQLGGDRSFCVRLTAQLKGTTDPETGERVAPNAALLVVIGQTLFRSVTKATSDYPTHQALARACADLPFREESSDNSRAH
jgi:hypothetical protein